MQIPLSDGIHEAIIDPKDVVIIAQRIWWPRIGEDGNIYAYTEQESNGKKETIYMHRLVLGLTNPKLIGDHINGNTLDNRRANLRIATKSQNAVNRRKKKPKSGYVGVRANGARWQAFHYINKKFHSLGQFDTPQEAAMVYDKIMFELHGEFAVLNGV